jgi:hypothetical protein
LLHFFLSREKSGKHSTKEKIETVKTPTAMLRQAQHDKAQETLQLAARFMRDNQYGHLNKFTAEQADAGSGPA